MMKKNLILLFVSLFVLACSDDDSLDNGENPNDTADSVFYYNIIDEVPTWEVESSLYETSMQVTCAAFIAADTLGMSPDDMVAAFIGDECRGVASQATILAEGALPVFYISIMGNGVDSESVTFKLFKAADMYLQVADESISFSPNGNQGTADQPLVLRAVF